MRIHAICIALNEEPFITALLRSLYDFCSGISVITQFDRDYYGNHVSPDLTIDRVLSYPDPKGKIHLVCRRYNDETASRNHEMQAILANPTKGIISHGVALEDILKFHESPDYFLIVDADEIYDINTLGNIIDYLSSKRPKGMRISAHQYKFTWNQRIPMDVIHHQHFGFVKAGILFEQRRVITWNEQRIKRMCEVLSLPDFSKRVFGFIDCPMDIGMFHHGSYLGGEAKLIAKFAKHSHQEVNTTEYINNIKNLSYTFVPTEDLPKNIQEGSWPKSFFSTR